jgi:hypothetical protein
VTRGIELLEACVIPALVTQAKLLPPDWLTEIHWALPRSKKWNVPCPRIANHRWTCPPHLPYLQHSGCVRLCQFDSWEGMFLSACMSGSPGAASLPSSVSGSQCPTKERKRSRKLQATCWK